MKIDNKHKSRAFCLVTRLINDCVKVDEEKHIRVRLLRLPSVSRDGGSEAVDIQWGRDISQRSWAHCSRTCWMPLLISYPNLTVALILSAVPSSFVHQTFVRKYSRKRQRVTGFLRGINVWTDVQTGQSEAAHGPCQHWAVVYPGFVPGITSTSTTISVFLVHILGSVQ